MRFEKICLKDIAIFKNGKKRPNAKGKIPVYGGNGVLSYTNEQNYENCIVIGRVGEYCGSVYYEPHGCWVSDNAIAVKPRNNTNINFLYYLLKQLHLNTKHIGTSQPLLTQEILNNICCAIPEIDIQQKIAHYLTMLDDKIENNTKINHHLEQMAQAIFKSWFVDFEPFGGKRPTDWVNCRADEIFDISIGKTPPRKEPQWFTENPNDIVWVSISDMGNYGIYISNSSEYLTKEAVQRYNVKVVPTNTVLLSFKLTVGRVAITNGEMTTNEAIAHFKTDDATIVEYLYCYLKTFNYQSLGSTSSIATAVNSKTIKAMPIVVPASKVVADFHYFASPIFEHIRHNLEESTRLAQIRDALLPRLMSGELSVDSLTA